MRMKRDAMMKTPSAWTGSTRPTAARSLASASLWAARTEIDVTITRLARVALRADSPLDPSPKASGKVVAFRRKR